MCRFCFGAGQSDKKGLIQREKASSDNRLKKVLPTSHTVEMKEQVERHITLLEKRLTAGIGAEELEIFSNVLKKMQENMELTEREPGMDKMPDTRSADL